LNADEVDNKIIAALVEDGRASFRDIAKKASVTTPTVSARINRMVKAGLILGFVPLLAPGSFERGVVAIISLRSRSNPEVALRKLALLKEVEAAYLTTGDAGISIRVAVESVHELQRFLRENVGNASGLSLDRSEIVTDAVKESPPLPSTAVVRMDLRCDYCGEPVKSSRPYNLAGGSARYYFCCRTCRSAYQRKYSRRLTRAAQRHTI
jgi:DNA-binding Lrp family transcriptional regulator